MRGNARALSNPARVAGCDDSLPPGPNNDVFTLRTSGEFTWARPSIKGLKPQPRWRHSASVWQGKIVVFGGYFSNTARYNDVWMFDPATLTWECLHEGTSIRKKGCVCACIARHCLAPPPAHAWRCSEPLPQPRGAHSASVVGNRLIVFAGYGGSGFSRKDFNDLYAFDLVERQWEKIAAKGTVPAARAGALLLLPLCPSHH